MTISATAPMPAQLAGLSLPGCRLPLPLLECLSFTREELARSLVDLKARSGASQLVVLSTCERTELYATWAGAEPPGALVSALSANRGLPRSVVAEAATPLYDREAVRHLLRVTAGLESFVLGESDIVGQVRTAAEAGRRTGVSGLELDRLLATAVNTSRRVHRDTHFGEGERSVAAAAVDLVAHEHEGDLLGQRVLVVGAGQLAAELVVGLARLGAMVTVCNRTRRHAERFAAAGATVVDLDRLTEVIASVDVAIFATASPHRLLGPAHVAASCVGSGAGPARDLLVVDLCVPRNVSPEVAAVPGLRLVDLAGLRETGVVADESVTGDVARAEEIVDAETDRYLRWLAGRPAAASVRRLRADVDARAREQVEQAMRGLPEDVRPLVADRVRRVVHQLAHGPTMRLLEAAEDGDERLVEAMSGVFADHAQSRLRLGLESPH